MKAKKFLIPAVLFVAVFCAAWALQRYTLVFMEATGLFLWTPDWLRETFSECRPVSHFVAGFLVQFYAVPALGALITAALVTLVFVSLSTLLSRLGLLPHRLVAVLAAVAVWVVAAFQPDNSLLVSATLYSLAAAGLSLLLKKKELRERPVWESWAAIGIILLGGILLAVLPKIRETERMAQVQLCARNGQWSKVLKAATPEACRKDSRLMPYAFLALSGEGQLGDRLFHYPVTGPQDFDREGDLSQEGYLFNSLLYEKLGSPNEALHNLFQFSCHLPHGLSHLSLYQMIRYNMEAGNYTLVRKYADILRHNPRSSHMARQVLDRVAGLPDERRDTLGHSSAKARVFSKNRPDFNLAQLELSGVSTSLGMDRFLAYLLLNADLPGFANTTSRLIWTSGKIPVHYQEALLLAGVDGESAGASAQLQEKFADFLSALQAQDNEKVKALTEGTYWAYYLMLQDRVAEEMLGRIPPHEDWPVN